MSPYEIPFFRQLAFNRSNYMRGLNCHERYHTQELMSFHFIFMTNFIRDKNPLYGTYVLVCIIEEISKAQFYYRKWKEARLRILQNMPVEEKFNLKITFKGDNSQSHHRSKNHAWSKGHSHSKHVQPAIFRYVHFLTSFLGRLKIPLNSKCHKI